jgi:transcriptional regulator with XRE-family HTH domain
MPEGLGTRLRQARQERGLSLRSLASALGVSASLVSQVEMGKTQPSVATLYAMANHLGVSLDGLVGRDTHADLLVINGPSPSGGAVQRGSDNPAIEMENGVRWERLASESGGPADPILVTYEPGGSSSIEGKLMRHVGIEYAYILEGELVLQLEFDTITVSAGDSLCFDSERPHMYSNHGSVRARGIWFVAGRQNEQAQLPALRPSSAAGTPAAAVEVLRSR